MESRRVVELRRGTNGVGSGYLLSDRHVVTARHVVDPCELGAPYNLAPLRGAMQAGKVDWLSQSDDLAIVVASEGGWPGLPRPLPDFAVAPEGFLRFCTARGFPAASNDDDNLIEATVSWMLKNEPPMLKLDIGTALPGVADWWAGFSGAVVFAGDEPVGVTAQVERNYNGMLRATPIARLRDDDRFRAYWQQQGLAMPALRPANPIRVSANDRIAHHVCWIDRGVPTREVVDHLRVLQAKRRCPPQIFLAYGKDDDVHSLLITRLARDPETRRLLGGNEGRQEDVIGLLPWPDLAMPIKPANELSRILEYLHATLNLPPPAPQAAPDLATLRAALDRPTAPRAFSVHIRQAVALGGYVDLLSRLLQLWTGMGPGAPVFLFVCLALDEPKPPAPSRSWLGVKKTPLEGEDLVQALKNCPALEDQAVELSDLTPIQQADLDPWIRVLRRECASVPTERFSGLHLGLTARLREMKPLRHVMDDIEEFLAG